MTTETNTTPCTCGRTTFWTLDGAAICWACTPEGVAVVATETLRVVGAGFGTGRVFAPGRTVPAGFVGGVEPVV